MASRQSAEKRVRFLNVLQRHAPAALDAAATELNEKALSAIYCEVLVSLRESSCGAWVIQLLDFIVLAGGDEVPQQLLEKCFYAAQERSARDVDLAELSYNSALTVLKRYQLVQLNCNGVSMHSLTVQLLHALMFDRVLQRSRQLIEAGEAIINEGIQISTEHGLPRYAISGLRIADFLWDVAREARKLSLDPFFCVSRGIRART